MSNSNSKYVNSSGNSVSDGILQLTLRELQGLYTNKRVWIGLLAVVTILTMAGPFGTDKTLGHAERFVYWGLEATLTFFCGVAVATTTHRYLNSRMSNKWAPKIISAIVVGFPISLIVFVTNLFFFGRMLASWNFYLSLLGSCLIISIGVSTLYYLIAGVDEKNEAENDQASSPFLKRLPIELGKNLLHISSQDHYVEAVTDRGSHMVLMRFTDALEELDQISGIQIHRSHWVAHSAIEETTRKDGRLFVKTVDDNLFPVSRNFLKSVRRELELT